jgi:hypothetical protein
MYVANEGLMGIFLFLLCTNNESSTYLTFQCGYLSLFPAANNQVDCNMRKSGYLMSQINLYKEEYLLLGYDAV